MTTSELDKYDEKLSEICKKVQGLADIFIDFTASAKGIDESLFLLNKDKFVNIFDGLNSLYFEYAMERVKVIEKMRNEKYQTK